MPAVVEVYQTRCNDGGEHVFEHPDLGCRICWMTQETIAKRKLDNLIHVLRARLRRAIQRRKLLDEED